MGGGGDKMKTYLTNCVDSDAESINNMVEKARQITYKTLLRHIRKAEIDSAFPCYEGSGLHIKNDWAVSFYSSIFQGKKCVYVEHSRIEYIFV